MSEPISAIITGLVSALSAYMTYKVNITKASQGTSSPATNAPNDIELKHGQQALEVIKSNITQRGTEDDRADFERFERNPQRYKDLLINLLKELANRDHAFAQQLQNLAQQSPSSGIHEQHIFHVNDNKGGVVADTIHGPVTVNQARRATDRELAELQIVMEATLSYTTKGFFNKKEWDKTIPCHIQARFRNKTTGHKEIIELFNGNLYLEQVEGTLWYNLARADLERLESDTVDLLIALNRKGWDTVAITDYVDVNPKMSRFYMPSNPDSLYVFEPIKIESSTNLGSITIIVGGANLKSVP